MLCGPSEAGNEAEVNWWCDREKQQVIGIILKTARKGMSLKLYLRLTGFTCMCTTF